MESILLGQLLFKLQLLLLAGCQLLFEIFCAFLEQRLMVPALLHLLCRFVLHVASFSLPVKPATAEVFFQQLDFALKKTQPRFLSLPLLLNEIAVTPFKNCDYLLQ